MSLFSNREVHSDSGSRKGKGRGREGDAFNAAALMVSRSIDNMRPSRRVPPPLTVCPILLSPLPDRTMNYEIIVAAAAAIAVEDRTAGSRAERDFGGRWSRRRRRR